MDLGNTAPFKRDYSLSPQSSHGSSSSIEHHYSEILDLSTNTRSPDTGMPLTVICKPETDNQPCTSNQCSSDQRSSPIPTMFRSSFSNTSINLSPAAIYGAYCHTVQGSKSPHPISIRDFIFTAFGRHISPERLNSLVDEVMKSYSTPRGRKAQRPFKNLPRNPEEIPARFAVCDLMKPNPYQQVEEYNEYRRLAKEKIRNANGGQMTITNPRMRRTNSNSQNGQSSDENRSDDNEARYSEHCENDTCSVGSVENNDSKPSTTQNGVVKDAAYYERRRKNNLAAKKSRDRRRLKEDELAIRNQYLETQCIELFGRADTLFNELNKLKAREVTLLCEKATYERREQELRRMYEAREADLLQRLKEVETQVKQLLQQKHDEVFFSRHNSSGINVQPPQLV